MLLQFSDVNAFLTLAATRHKITSDELREKPRVQEILNAAKEGKVPVYLVSSKSSVCSCVRSQGATSWLTDLSEKNPLEVLPHDATLISLLTIFARGAHRGQSCCYDRDRDA